MLFQARLKIAKSGNDRCDKNMTGKEIRQISVKLN